MDHLSVRGEREKERGRESERKRKREREREELTMRKILKGYFN